MISREEVKNLTLGQYLEQTTNCYKNKPAYVCNNIVLSFDELEKKSRRLAYWFQSMAKLTEGDRVAIQLPNINEYPIAVFAALRAGLIIVNTNPMYTSREMKHQFTDSGAKAIIILDELIDKLSSFIEETDIEHVVTVSLCDFYENDESTRAKICPNPQNCFSTIINLELPESLIGVATKPSDIALIQYTGGTTGVSKGASLTHKNILSNVLQLKERFENIVFGDNEVFVSPLPLYHIYAFTVNMMCFFGLGGVNLLIQKPQSVDEFVDVMQRYKATGFVGINTLFVNLCQSEIFRKLNFSHLKFTLSGGSTLTDDASNIWIETTNTTITEGYGLSETAPAISFNKPQEEEVGTVGKPTFDTTIRIIDKEANELPDGQEGEITVKGPQVMKGYWQREKETQAVFTPDGYFKTGDVGVFLPSGSLKIVDRIKDMILVSGFNVYPNEIENILTLHNKVIEAAVVGKPSDKTGEAVWAYVVVSGEVTPEEIQRYCREQLTSYKVPKHIVILDSLPKSTVGKILRRELKK